MILPPVSVFWFRRDLRLTDNAGLFHALKSGYPVLPVFIFDSHILDRLKKPDDKRVEFIYQSLQILHKELHTLGSAMYVMYGTPLDCWKKLSEEYQIKHVFTNHDYEPYAKERDAEIGRFLSEKGTSFQTCKDQCIFEKSEVVKENAEPYTVFTPYSKKWKQKLNPFYLKPYPTEKYFGHFFQYNHFVFPRIEEIGFRLNGTVFPENKLKENIIRQYGGTRNIPSIAGTSRLSVHLRFGTVSIRSLAAKALEWSEPWLNELIWREFYMMILWHFPHVTGCSFKPEYDHIEWRNKPEEFEKWCAGQTGYPIVDAGMRELNETGYMHNRIRMVTASFLTKHLLIDWRWGEAWFAEKLLDFDLSANNGGWQWSAGCGCDAAPYFRVFNPDLQTLKFDRNHEYIRKWVPEWQEFTYPKPMVVHEIARKRALDVYGKALKKELA